MATATNINYQMERDRIVAADFCPLTFDRKNV